MDSSKKTAALTPWFAASVKPVRVGVYETRLTPIAAGFTYWGGKKWGWQCFNVADAYRAGAAGHQSAVQEKPWRGLASPPEQK